MISPFLFTSRYRLLSLDALDLAPGGVELCLSYSLVCTNSYVVFLLGLELLDLFFDCLSFSNCSSLCSGEVALQAVLQLISGCL